MLAEAGVMEQELKQHEYRQQVDQRPGNPEHRVVAKATISGSLTAMRRWPVSRSVRPVKATEVDSVASAAANRRRAPVSRSPLRRREIPRSAAVTAADTGVPFDHTEAQQGDAEHGDSGKREVDTAGDHVIAADGNHAHRPKQRIASGTLCTSIMLIFCQLKRKATGG